MRPIFFKIVGPASHHKKLLFFRRDKEERYFALRARLHGEDSLVSLLRYLTVQSLQLEDVSASVATTEKLRAVDFARASLSSLGFATLLDQMNTSEGGVSAL